MKKTFRKLLSLGLAAAMTAGMVTAASAASRARLFSMSRAMVPGMARPIFL